MTTPPAMTAFFAAFGAGPAAGSTAQMEVSRNSIEYPDINTNLTTSLPTITVTPPPEDIQKKLKPVVLTAFPLFAKLPPEIRSMAWNFAAVPRIVSFTPGGGKPLGAMYANRESYFLLRPQYHLHVAMFTSRAFEDVPDFGVFVNYDKDILHINPLCAYFFNPRPGETHPIDPVLLAFPNGDESLERANIEHTLQLRQVKNIAFDLESQYGPSHLHEMWDSMMSSQLVEWCPALQNLYIVQNNNIRTSVENLQISSSGTSQEVEAMDTIAAIFDRWFASDRLQQGSASEWWNHKVNVKFVKSVDSESEEDEDDGNDEQESAEPGEPGEGPVDPGNEDEEDENIFWEGSECEDG